MKQITIDKMRQLNLSGMLKTYQADLQNNMMEQYSTLEYIDVLINAQWEHRYNERIKRLKQQAHFRQGSYVADIDYRVERGIDKQALLNLLTLTFMTHHQNIIITGATGTGKSFLAQCIGTKACDSNHTVLYYTMAGLSIDIDMNQLKGTYAKWLKKLQDCQLLILDDLGLTGITPALKKALMEIIDYKYDRSSLIISSQLPVSKWHALINDDTIADALLDRIIHKAHRIELKGESMRRHKKI